MPSSDLIRALIDAILPEGAIWEYKVDGDLDHLYSGMADNAGTVHDFLGSLAHVRDALKTPVLDDLELDYGITKNTAFSEQERREQLKSVFPRRSSGTAEYLQQRLRDAGITNVYVHRNDPPISPLGYGWTICGREDAICGRDNAQAGDGGTFGCLLVNGKSNDDDYVPCYDECDGFWAGVFFIGGPATRDPVTHKIIDIECINVPIRFKPIMERIIMETKPFHSWAYELIIYV